MSLSRFDTWVRSAVGPAAAGTQVFICTQPASISSNPTPQAQLYSDSAGTVPISQPLIADGFGHAYAYVLSGTYTVVLVQFGQVQTVLPDQALGAGGVTLPITFTPVNHEYFVGYDSSSGEFTAQQPIFADLSDMAAPSQLPVMVGDSGSGGVQGVVPAPPAGSAAAVKFLKADGTWQVPAGTGIGISSVGLTTDSSFFTISNSPLVSNGTITMNLTTGLAQNKVLATPDGTSGVVGLRSLVVADLPNLPASQITSGVLALARGGNFFNALGDLIYGGVAAAPTVVSGNTAATRKFLGQTGTGTASAAPAWAAIALTDLPTIPNSQLANAQLTVNGDGTVFASPGPTIVLGSNGALALVSQSANKIFAGPTSGGSTTPTFRSLVAGDIPAQTKVITYIIDGGGNVPSTGTYGQLWIPFACTIAGWTISGDQSGSAVVDVLTSTYAGFPTTSSIAGSDKPTLSSAQKNQDSTLTGWGNTSIAANSFVQFALSSVSACTRITVSLTVTSVYA